MRDATKLTGVAVAALLAGAAAAGQGKFKVADSYEDFAGIQGINGWYYGYYNGNVANAYTPDDFEQMGVYDPDADRWWVDNAAGGPLTLIDSVFMHPYSWSTTTEGDQPDHWAVRRWVSEIDGQVEIDVSMLRGPANNLGDGVRLHVFVDGVRRLIAELDPNNAAGLSMTLFETVAVGSVIDFAIDPINSAHFDGTKFNAVIMASVPAPSALALVGLGGLVAVRPRR